MALGTVFADLSWNIETLSSIKTNQTLLVVGNRLDFDHRYFQTVRRYWTGDGRQEILLCIQKTMVCLDEILAVYQSHVYLNKRSMELSLEQADVCDTIRTNLESLVSRHDAVVQGLQILSTFERYQHDSGFNLGLKRAMESFNKIVGRTQKMLQRWSAQNEGSAHLAVTVVRPPPPAVPPPSGKAPGPS